ncbi:tetratricopeptide repeat protein [Thalassotalea euphylliae]|uniref:tetratricopeptide repeat protein n=1 Tax=Thalassotalea euphylliae TaxID=1655234 RepID=UPI00362F7771
MFIRVTVVLSLLLVLATSSFSFERYINSVASPSDNLVWFALKHNAPSAHQFVVERFPIESNAWFNSAKFVAISDADIANQLAQIYEQKGDYQNAVSYWQQSIMLGNDESVYELASFYYLQEKYDVAWQLLAKARLDNINENKQWLMARASLAVGSELSSIVSQNDRYLNKFSLFGYAPEAIVPAKVMNRCEHSITLVAGNYEDLRHWQHIKAAYDNSPLAEQVCVKAIQYIPLLDLVCEHDIEKAIQCSESFWKKWAHLITSKYIAVLRPKGGANVHFGILYLDRTDTAQVFQHEVAHLVGFADEYTLSATHNICNGGIDKIHINFSLLARKDINGNMVTLKNAQKVPWFKAMRNEGLAVRDSYPIGEALTEQGLGFFISETCSANKENIALKPLRERGFMRNYNLPVPDQYLTLLDQSEETSLMPPFTYNIALALYQEGKVEQAKEWLVTSATFFQSPDIQTKTLRGGF